MSIKPVEVKRDKDGYWSHPEFPWFEEDSPDGAYEAWALSNGVTTCCIEMYDDAPEDVVDEFVAVADGDCSKWTPSMPTEKSFLLSIFDTEDGPIALWATPIIGEK